MTWLNTLGIRVRIGSAVAVGLAAMAAGVIAATGVAHGSAARQQTGFGAAARVAVGQAAAKLAPGSGISGTAEGR